MANSIQNKKEASSEDFSDTLDAMLNEAESLMDESDESKEDDIMDQLIMEDVFDVADEEIAKLSMDEVNQEKIEENTKVITEKIADTQNDEIDEFSDDEPPSLENKEAEIKAEKNDDDFEADDLLDSVEVESSAKQNETSDIDEFGEDEDSLVVSEQDDEVVEEIIENKEEPLEIEVNKIQTEIEDEQDPDSDLLMTDFDISADDDISELENEADTPAKVDTTEAEKQETDLQLLQANEKITEASIAIDELSNKINQLVEDNEVLKQQITGLATASNQDNFPQERLEELKKEQLSIRKYLKDNEQYVPVLTYVALGLAGFALLVGGGLGAVGYGAQSDVAELSELVTTLDEETDILAANNSKAEINILNDKINQLGSKDDHFSTQLDEINAILQSDPLQPVVNDLVEKNNQAQQAIEKLLVKVESIEKRKFVTATTSVKKPKKVAKNISWAVNLVSFKQEWYAKSKATEFEKKGVPTDVLAVTVKGEKWYRLRVKGFKSKYEAAAYAVKVKKTLNLSSVWVTKV